MSDLVEEADRLGRRRARLFFIIAVLLLSQQVTYFSLLQDGAAPLRKVDIVKLASWAITTLAALAALMSGGGLFRRREIRALLNDEVFAANRAKALSTAFALTVLSGVAVFVVSYFEPVNGQTAVHLVLTIGMATGLLSFASLERRAHKVG